MLPTLSPLNSSILGEEGFVTGLGEGRDTPVLPGYSVEVVIPGNWQLKKVLMGEEISKEGAFLSAPRAPSPTSAVDG